MELPLVSIGIPTYNRPEGLKKVLECLINQTYQNIEIIISDNASTNQMVNKVVADYLALDTRIKFTQQKNNIGASDNFIFVLNQARGKYFMWAADDDEFSPITIEQSVNGFLQNNTAVLSSTMCNITSLINNTVTQPIYIPNTILCENEGKFRKVIDYMFNELNVFFYSLIKLDVLKKCKSYKTNHFSSDIFLLLELLEFGDIYINTSCVGLNYFVSANQASALTLEKYINSIKDKINFWDRHLFFSKYLFHYFILIFKSKKLKISEKAALYFYVIKKWISTKKFHLIKYDLGLHKPIQWLKKSTQKNYNGPHS